MPTFGAAAPTTRAPGGGSLEPGRQGPEAALAEHEVQSDAGTEAAQGGRRWV